MELPRGFKGVWIPKEIWLASDMTLAEKVIFAEIDSLDQKNGCFAKNEHFAQFVGKSEKQVSRIIAKLKDKGMIEVTQENIKGTTRRTMRSAQTLLGGRGGQKRPEGVDINGHPSISNTMSNTSVAATSAAPFDLRIELDKLKKDKRRHIQLIGEYLEEKKISLENKDELQIAVKRHCIAAVQLAKFGDQKIGWATEVAMKEYPAYTLETLIKILTR